MNLFGQLAVCALALTVGVARPADASTSKDMMCEELAKFANSSEPDNSFHTVTLTTSWAPFNKSCAHGGYAPGLEFCKWLLDNTSAEFAASNIRRVLSCLGGAEAYAGNSATFVKQLTGAIESGSAKYVKEDGWVVVEFSTGVPGQNSVLAISAKRSKDE